MSSRVLKNRPGVKKKSPWAGVLMACSVVFVTIAAMAGGLVALGNSWLEDLPDYENLDEYNTSRKTEVYASDGTTLLAEFYIENREPVTLDEISSYVIEGTVATEDERFYEHSGYDLIGIARAFVVNLTGSSFEGASTITQQLIRNTILSDEATDISLKRKVREIYLAMKVEQIYSKDEILLMYLNTINYGSGAYGIQAAAQRYFSKDASELTLVEAATLIGIPQSPTYNNPIDYPENALERRNTVLARMLSNNIISQAEYDEAIEQPLELNVSEQSSDGIYLYPYFTSYVRELLLENYSTAEVFRGGLTVYTTIDVDIQEAAEAAADAKEAEVGEPYEVAITAIDPDTGYILAMVGGKDYEENQWNLATQALRQPGSSFKTFTLIAALEAGISPSTMISCSTSVTIDGTEFHNIGNANYGTRSIASAFAVSSNTAFVRLATAVGYDKVIEVAQRLGIETELHGYPSTTLGAEEVTVLEMAQAYATIANGGTARSAIAITRIENADGETIYDVSEDEDAEGVRAITPEIAYAAIQVMEGVVTSGTGTSAALSSGQPVAGKTGTSDDYADRWFVGFTPQIAVAIWIGDRLGLNEGGQSVPSSVTVGSVFSDFVGTVLEGQPIEYFTVAADPVYTDYVNEELGIGVSSSSSSEDDEEEESEEETSEETGSETESGETGSESSGETGSESGSETGSESGGETGSESGGETGSESGGETTTVSAILRDNTLRPRSYQVRRRRLGIDGASPTMAPATKRYQMIVSHRR